VTIVPEQKHAVLETANLTNEKYLLLRYLHNVQQKVFIVPLESLEKRVLNNPSKNGNSVAVNDLSQTNSSFRQSLEKSIEDWTLVEIDEGWIGLPDAQEVELPVGSSVYSSSCRRDESRVFIHCVGYTLAGRIYKYQFHSADSPQTNTTQHVPNGSTNYKERKPFGGLSIWRESTVDGFEPDQWAVEQVWVPKPHDGVKVTMFIIRDKSHVKTGDSFCLLYG
jgi:prolyl oligopeptidase PreP (S9A serine peptidase family)